ncbi:hypothetical protein TIFTF001_042463 [Ficus carica]|uniref:Uncharacterized protein n=1 Tax=Ficus carica TaxID=3494 RepID=A0AA88CZF2_FICCA|nr:hypothetical protein TIFTF001_042463 [Ficus carica]
MCMEGAAEIFWKLTRAFKEGVGGTGVAGSPRFGVYEVDFGWGKPEKVEIVSVERTGAMALVESRDGSGGIEIGLVLKKHKMDVFSSLFHAGLENQCLGFFPYFSFIVSI